MTASPRTGTLPAVMPLPDATRLLQLGPSSWQGLGARLREVGLTPAAAAPMGRMMRGLSERAREPLLKWNVRRIDSLAGLAMRLFLCREPIPADAARRLFGALDLDAFIESGFVVPEFEDTVAYPYRLNLFNDLFVVTDDLLRGPDAVMGAGETTVDLCNAAYPRRKIDRALDLGCGAGTGALLVASRAREVVGVDINPRAIVLSRVNAALNGIDNVDFRQGDLFGPVAGERFDLIFSQPPFVPMPDEEERVAFLHGGRRGDELPLRVLAGIPQHLTPAGRAVLLVEWPILDGERLDERIRNAVASPELDLLLLRDPGSSVDTFAAGYAAAHAPTLGLDFERRAEALRSHFERVGIREFRFGFVVLERSRAAQGWTAVVDTRALSAIRVSSGRIDSLIAARRLADADRDTLLAARLRVPGETVFAEERRSPELEAPPVVYARFADDALLPEIQLNQHSYHLVRGVHAATDVRAAIEQFAEAFSASLEEACEKVLPAVREALRMGILEVT